MSADFQSDQAQESTLQVYLLGCLDFETFLALQRRLHYEITGDRRRAALILCEHPPIITVGRQGSRSHIRLETDDLRQRRWPIRWVQRRGGCVLHLPGQLAVCPILPLDRLCCGVPAYVQTLGATLADVMGDFSIRAPVRASDEGIWVGERMLAALGVSVRDWVSGFGAYVNLHPALDAYRCVGVAMTSLQRERRGPVRPSLVRERLIEHFQHRFGFGKVALFSDHPMLHGMTQRCAEPVLAQETT